MEFRRLFRVCALSDSALWGTSLSDNPVPARPFGVARLSPWFCCPFTDTSCYPRRRRSLVFWHSMHWVVEGRASRRSSGIFFEHVAHRP